MFEFFGETILRITSLSGKKSIFSSVGSFEYFRETILRIPSLKDKKGFFSSLGYFKYFRETNLRITFLPGKKCKNFLTKQKIMEYFSPTRLKKHTFSLGNRGPFEYFVEDNNYVHYNIKVSPYQE